MITFTTRSGNEYRINFVGIIAWVVLVVAVVTQNVWLAVIPAVYLMADSV